jgi:dUTP pyrophosphatase
MLRFQRLTDHATLPTRGSDQSVGYDLYSAQSATIPAFGKALICTDIAFEIPRGHYGRIAPRSGFSWKKHTDIGAGVIDPDYRGNVKVLVFNHSRESIEVAKGDRIAQLILEKVSVFSLKEVTDLDETERGAGGFGSTGMR